MKEVGDTVVLGDLPPHLFGASSSASPADAPAPKWVPRTLDEVEHEHVMRVLEHVGGNKSRAAKILGISRPALDRKLGKASASSSAQAGVE
jgi:ActR/RegA family two-component response regulator